MWAAVDYCLWGGGQVDGTARRVDMNGREPPVSESVCVINSYVAAESGSAAPGLRRVRCASSFDCCSGPVRMPVIACTPHPLPTQHSPPQRHLHHRP